jgi:hypothetical protein
MSAIANFKKRRQAQREQLAQLGQSVAEKLSTTPENEALQLLAELIGCDVKDAIAEAKKLVDKAAYIVWSEANPVAETATVIGVDLASGQDETVSQTVSELESSADSVDNAAAAVNQSAEQVSSAASDLDDTASQLAYSADDIGHATAELKEATEELKKPSAVHQSSRGAKAEKRKGSSKK